MTTTTNTTDTTAIGYANSHGTVRISAKRFTQSPYAARYVNEKTISFNPQYPKGQALRNPHSAIIKQRNLILQLV